MEDEHTIRKLWEAEISDTIPLEQANKAAYTKKTKTKVSDYTIIDYCYDAPVIPGDEIIHYQQENTCPKIYQQLASGKLAIIKAYDFHGYTTASAHEKLSDILQYSDTNNHRCLLMVHGKGHLEQKSILKGYLYRFLRLHPKCRAYHSAQPKHGGTGSIYVLI